MASKHAKSDTKAGAPVAPLTTEDIGSTKASREKDKEEGPVVARVDLGESIPTRPIPTATDNE